MIELYDAWLADLGFTLLTSRDANERGGHISIGHPDAARICVALRQFANVIPDYRTPNSIRLAISPLPTSYVEIWDGFLSLGSSTFSTLIDICLYLSKLMLFIFFILYVQFAH